MLCCVLSCVCSRNHKNVVRREGGRERATRKGLIARCCCCCCCCCCCRGCRCHHHHHHHRVAWRGATRYCAVPCRAAALKTRCDALLIRPFVSYHHHHHHHPLTTYYYLGLSSSSSSLIMATHKQKKKNNKWRRERERFLFSSLLLRLGLTPRCSSSASSAVPWASGALFFLNLFTAVECSSGRWLLTDSALLYSTLLD